MNKTVPVFNMMRLKVHTKIYKEQFTADYCDNAFKIAHNLKYDGCHPGLASVTLKESL